MVIKRLINLFKNKKVKKNISRKRISRKRIKIKVSKGIKSKKAKANIKEKAIKKKLIAYATHYFSKIKVAILKMKDMLKIGDQIHIKGYTTDFKQTITSLQINHQPVKVVKKGQEIGLLVKRKVRHKDKVYKI